jgi:hypothetical protein
MPRAIHVTVTYSVHIEDDRLSEKEALIHASENFEKEGRIFDVKASVFERWQNVVRKIRRGIGSS